MSIDPEQLLRRTIADTVALHERAATEPAAVLAAAERIVAALRTGGKVLLCGNGGSALDAQHVAAELVGRFERRRAALAAVALTTDTSVLTSIANDEAFEQVFARQIEALGRPGDVVVGITTSGGSANVVAAIHVARQRGIDTIALTGGDGGAAGRLAALHVNVPSTSTARVQEVHRTLLHVICDLVERGCAEPVH